MAAPPAAAAAAAAAAAPASAAAFSLSSTDAVANMLAGLMNNVQQTNGWKETWTENQSPESGRWSVGLCLTPQTGGAPVVLGGTTTWSGEGATKAEARSEARKLFLQSRADWSDLIAELLHSRRFVLGKPVDVSESALTEYKGGPAGQSPWPFSDFFNAMDRDRGLGAYVCAFLNGMVDQRRRILYGIEDASRAVQGIAMTDPEWDKILRYRDSVVRLLYPAVKSNALIIDRFPVSGTTQTTGPLWVVQVIVEPDPHGRLFWYNKDCWERGQGSISKMDPAAIQARMLESMLLKLRS